MARQLPVREIPLSQGLVALVDGEDYEQVMAAGRWFAQRNRGTFYARRNIQLPDRTRTMLNLHTFLTGWSYVDHHNGNGLDNRRVNLRPATHAENNRNQRLRRDNGSGFKGVTWYKATRRWQAQIRHGGQRRHLGYHGTSEDAARAYDAAAREFHGEFARLNFPINGERSAL